MMKSQEIDITRRTDNKIFGLLSLLLNGVKYGVDLWEDSFVRNGELLTRMVEYHLADFYEFKFIKFIDVFNNHSKNQLFNIECYLDFIHSVGGTKRIGKGKKLLTSDRKKVDVGNSMLKNMDDMTNALHNKHRFCKQFEYSLEGSDSFLLPNRYGVYRDEKKKFVYGADVARSSEDIKDCLEKLLKSVDTCYDKTDNHLTNFLFFMGSPWLNNSHNPWLKNNDDSLRGQDSDNKDGKWKSSVCAVVGIDKRKGDMETIKTFVQHFQSFVEQLSFVIIEEVHSYELRQTAVVASIAQVMARNMSHNIGSHVFSNLINQDVYERLSDSVVLKNDTYRPHFNNLNAKQNSGKRKEVPLNLQVAYFNQYLKSRMDYLSEVTFGVPNMLTTKYLYSDVFKELDRVRILLNHISGIPDFRYTFCLKYNGAVLSSKNDIAIALPSDVLGNQAFYNIIENIIRNTAKHAYRSEQQTNTITIEFINVDGLPEYYCVEIDNGVNEAGIDDLVKKQNNRINASVLDKENNLRNHSLGLLEMEASAAFLRQVDIAKVDSFEYHFGENDSFRNKYDNLILFKAINKNGALGYRFLLQKPKEFLLVGNWPVEESKMNELLNYGIRFIQSDDFVKAVEEGTSFVHPFLLYQDTVSERVKELLSDDNDSKTLLPIRKMMLESEVANTITKRLYDAEQHEVVRLLKDIVWTKYYENVILKELNNPNNDGLMIRPEYDPGKGNAEFISNQVVFLNHADTKSHAKQWDKVRNADDCEVWIENLLSRTSAKLPWFNKYSVGEVDPVSDYVENIRKLDPIKYEIFEAYHNKVLVLDERVQNYANICFEGSSKDADGPIPCRALFESTNVIIPKTPLDPIDFNEDSIDDIEQFINDNLTNAFILIHYGILERMYRNESVITEKLNIWAKASKRLVVTSGRGAHSLTLPPSVCFVNLSSVLYAFTENRNKYIINNLLNQARRKNE